MGVQKHSTYGEEAKQSYLLHTTTRRKNGIKVLIL